MFFSLRSPVSFSVVCTLFCVPAALAQSAMLLKDFVVAEGDSYPDDFVQVADELYFTAGSKGARSYWKTNGTEAGTVPAGEPAARIRERGYFAFDDGLTGMELWKTDGTEAGAFLVKDINPGPADGVQKSLDSVLIDGTLFFAGNDGVDGFELWKSDGSEAGTVMVRNIYPADGGPSPSSFANLDGTLIFQAAGLANANQLWKSDGTPSGTVLVKSNLGIGRLEGAAASNGLLFLLTWHQNYGYWLWRTDGTEDGTIQLQEPFGMFEPQPNLVDAGGTLLFQRQRNIGINSEMRQGTLWTSDGTIEGTTQLKSFAPVAAEGQAVGEFVDYDGSWHFCAAQPSGLRDLWKTDATEAGTVPIGHLPTPALSVNGILGSYAGTLFLDVQEGEGDESPHHIARTRGTAETTTVDAQTFLGIGDFIGAGPNVFFVGSTAETGNELWALPLQPTIISSGIVDAAAFLPTLVPGGLASLFGAELAGDAASATTFPLPTTLAGVGVQVNGVQAPLLMVSPAQINFQVPYETPPGAGVSVIASLNGQQSLSQAVGVAEFAPAMFVNPNMSEPVVQRHADGSLITAQNPANPGDTLVVYVTGIGGLDNPPATGEAATDSPLSMASTAPTVLVGGVEATVLFAGLAPDYAGLGQINIELPEALPQGGPLPLKIQFGDHVSPTLELPF